MGAQVVSRSKSLATPEISKRREEINHEITTKMATQKKPAKTKTQIKVKDLKAKKDPKGGPTMVEGPKL